MEEVQVTFPTLMYSWRDSGEFGEYVGEFQGGDEAVEAVN
jgi:hypothetical protein